MDEKIIVWYDPEKDAVESASEEHTLMLEKTEFKLVIPVKSNILCRTHDKDAEEELTEFYLQGHGEIVLIVSPRGDKIGFIFTKEELRQLISRASSFDSLEEYTQELSEELEQPSPTL